MGFFNDLRNLTKPDLPKSNKSLVPIRTVKLAESDGRHVKRAGASVSGTMSNWISSIITSRIAERQRRTVSDRAWDLYTNDAMSHGLIESFIVEIVGTGLTPQAQPMLRWLGMESAWQEEYQARNYDLFEIWGMDVRNFCDAQRRLNIYMLQALALFYWKLDGIGVFQVVSDPSPYRPLSTCILPIDASRLVTPTDANSNDDIYDGVQLDKNGAPVKAYILKAGLKQRTVARMENCIQVDVFDKKTGLPKLLLVCDVRNIAEYRQDSILGPNIKEVKDSNDLTDAAIVKTLSNAMIALFIEDQSGQTQNMPVPIEERVHELQKGTVIYGNPGEVPHSVANDAPGPGYKDMNDAIVGRLGMATCRGPESIAKSYKASYSASQANIENCGKYDDVDRMVLVNRFCQPIEVWKQYEAALRGLIPVRSVQHFLDNLYAYSKTQWFPPKSRPIDKLKSANADEVRLANGTRNYSDIFGEQSVDWRAARRQRAIELQFDRLLEEEYGIKFEAEKPAGNAPQPQPGEQNVDN